MYSNHQWNEADHPRDNEGKFTFKGMGSSRNNSFINTETKNYINMQGIDIGNIKEILLKVLKNFIIPGVTVYATVNQLMKMIKRNKLEDKLEKAIQEFKKNNKQNSNKNNQESPSDTLYKDSNIKKQKEKEEAEYKSKLLNILGDKATQADVLYGTTKELEEKIKNYGMENRLNRKNNNAEFYPETIKRAREFIHGSEGYSNVAYQDKAGIWTIGYGHTGYVDGKPINQGMKITREKAEELYRKDFEDHITPLKDIKTPLKKPANCTV